MDSFEFSGEDCTEVSSPLGPEAGAGYGYALAVWQSPTTEKEWLVVGEPGRTTPAAEEGGAVSGVLFESDDEDQDWRTPILDFRLDSSLSGMPGDDTRGFGTAIAVGDFGMVNSEYPDIAVSSAWSDLRLPNQAAVDTNYSDIGVVEVFKGLFAFPPAPPFDTNAGEQRYFVLEAADRADDSLFGESLAVGDFLGDDGTDLAVGAPGSRLRAGVVSFVDDVEGVSVGASFVAVDLTAGSADAAVETDFSLSLQDASPASGDEYGVRVATLATPPDPSPALAVSPLPEGGPAKDLLVVGAPGKSYANASAVGTVCLLDASQSSAVTSQLCVHAADGAGLPTADFLRYGTAVAAGYLTPTPIGFARGYYQAEIVGGAPGLRAGVDQVGGVSLVAINRSGGDLDQPFDPLVYAGNDALGISGEDLKYGNAVVLMDVTGGGQLDIVASAPDAGPDDRGGFAWTETRLTSAERLDPGLGAQYYQWTRDSEDIPWEGDTLNLLVVDLQNTAQWGLSVWSETNHPWVIAAVGQCRELPVNAFNALPTSWDVLPGGGVGENSPNLFGCTGSAGARLPHVLEEEQVCEEPPDPPFVEEGDRWTRQIYSFDPHDSCGAQLDPILFPVTYAVPRLSVMQYDHDILPLLEDADIPVITFNQAEMRLRLIESAGAPPSTVELHLYQFIDASSELTLSINNLEVTTFAGGDDDDSASSDDDDSAESSFVVEFEHVGAFTCEEP